MAARTFSAAGVCVTAPDANAFSGSAAACQFTAVQEVAASSNRAVTVNSRSRSRCLTPIPAAGYNVATLNAAEARMRGGSTPHVSKKHDLSLSLPHAHSGWRRFENLRLYAPTLGQLRDLLRR